MWVEEKPNPWDGSRVVDRASPFGGNAQKGEIPGTKGYGSGEVGVPKNQEEDWMASILATSNRCACLVNSKTGEPKDDPTSVVNLHERTLLCM